MANITASIPAPRHTVGMSLGKPPEETIQKMAAQIPVDGIHSRCSVVCVPYTVLKDRWYPGSIASCDHQRSKLGRN